MYKRYIDVVVLMDKEGHLRPLFIVWDDGAKYQIDKIVDIKNAASQVGGCGILYKSIIQGKLRNLFYERNRWFIESTKP